MKTIAKVLLMVAFFNTALSSAGVSHEYTLGDLSIGHPWARASIGAATAGAAYLSITNNGTTADRLLKVSTPQAATAELHANILDQGVTAMRPVEKLDLPPGTTTALKPGGFHLMLTGLTAPLKEGTMFPMTLTFEKAGAVSVDVKVEPVGTTP